MKYVVGNWKMNCTLAEGRALIRPIRDGLADHLRVDVGVAPPAVLLMPMCKELAGTRIRLGAQNVFHEERGAYTGEISPAMLVDAGCRFVIIGHSERRQHFGEDGALLKKKVFAVVGAGLEVIYCAGETLEQRDAEQTETVLLRQLSEVFETSIDPARITIAYEPVWAIGTGRNATAAQAQEAHEAIRAWWRGTYGAPAAEQLRIQYGGSVNPGNAAELLAMPDVDGALVGGASLKPADFLSIVAAADASGASARARF